MISSRPSAKSDHHSKFESHNLHNMSRFEKFWKSYSPFGLEFEVRRGKLLEVVWYVVG